MKIFDRIDPLSLEHRDWQLWMLALAMLMVLASGVALLMYPTIFTVPDTGFGLLMKRSFFGFCVLSVLLIGYLMDRQLVIRCLRRQLIEEQDRVARVRLQASVDLLETLPGLDHFQDRLAMEFRRSMNTQQPLSLLMIGLKPSKDLAAHDAVSMAYGDAAKAVVRKLRGEDSIYHFRSGVFAVVLPNVAGADANRVASRLADGLTDVAGTTNRFFSDIRMINYPEHTSSGSEMKRMALTCFPLEATPSEASVGSAAAI